MAKLKWDETGKRTYETGVNRGVLYPMGSGGTYDKGVAWNGLTGVTESPSGAESSPLYADNIKYLNLVSAEELGLTIEAYTYPDEFAACDGTAEPTEGLFINQQTRKKFGLCYQTKRGNDVDGTDYGYKIHLVYGCQASPAERGYQTINESPEAITFSWTVSTTNEEVEGHKPTALAIIDSVKAGQAKMEKIEKILYGDESNEARLPSINELKTILES